MLVANIIYFLGVDRDNIPYSKTRRFSVMAYNRVIKKILDSHQYNTNILKRDVEKLQLTDYMKQKIESYFDRTVPKYAGKKILRSVLSNINGIGSKKAEELIRNGLTNIKQLNIKKYNDLLSVESKFVIKYRPLKNIPHTMIKKIMPTLTKFPNTFIVGGFRRKKTFSKDIDIMVVSKNINILDSYINHLKKHYAVVIYAKGGDKVSLFIKINRHIKLDVFRTLPSHKHAMLLYSTGSKIFNIKMRAVAKRQGYLLNQNGLFKNGVKINIKSEKGFFTKLGMEYTKPEKR